MRHIFLTSFISITAILAGSAVPAIAQISPEVLAPYKAYRKALKAEDYKTAKAEAFKAWEVAETTLGDHKTTGDLAQNFADIARKTYGKDQKSKPILRGYRRAIELSKFYDDNSADVYLQRIVAIGEFGAQTGRIGRIRKDLLAGEAFAQEKGLEKSTLLGEIYTLLSQSYIKERKGQKVEDYAEKAKAVFAKADDGYVSYHPVLATLYSGYGKEAEEKIVPAALEYQEVMQNVDNVLPRDHPLVMRALGRWMTMRNRVVREGLLDEAEEKGLCECWPYDKERNEAVQPIKRIPPIMPRNAYQSGFSIVEFDIKDDGSTTNIRIAESWPEHIFEKASEKAVRQWKYSPRTAGETDADRTDIITTVRYVLRDRYGNIIE